jgi:hypothetical protein
MSHPHHHIGNAKIYKLTFGEFFYYGSTYQSPCERLSSHKNAAKLYPERKIYKQINGCWGDVKIEVVERLKCQTRQEIRLRENEYIKQHLDNEKCLNERTAHLSPEELKRKKTEAQRIYRQNMTPEQKERVRQRQSERQRQRRSMLKAKPENADLFSAAQS